MQCLLRFSWPGNVRQLRNVLRYALALADGEWVLLEHLPRDLTDAAGEMATALPAVSSLSPISPMSPVAEGIRNLAREVEPGMERLLMSLRRNKWNVTAVSAELDICRATVYRQMKKFGIIPPNQQD